MDEVRACEVCSNIRSVVVTSLPGIPMSVARCLPCYEADAIPLDIAVANTVMIGGMAGAADWWKEVVADTLAHLRVPRQRFDGLVQEGIEQFDADMAAMAEREAAIPAGGPADAPCPW